MANAKKIKTASSAGLSRPDVTVGPADPVRARIARKAIGAGGFGSRPREAGMLIDTSQVSAPYSTGYKLEAYRSSYAYGLSDRTGAYDIPTYFVQMNEQNGGMLYWPVTLHEKLSWYRYWCYYLDDKHLGQVLMSDGTLKSIKDVNVGDEVITGTGTIRRVSEKIERHCKDPKAVEIDVWCLQNSTLVTHEHPFYILRKDQVKKDATHYRDKIEFAPEWVNADRVEPGDYVLMAPYKPEKFSDLTVSQASFLGYYAAEGSLIWGHRCIGTVENGESSGYKWHQEKIRVPTGVSFSLNKNEEDTVGKKILELSQSVFGVEGKIVRRRENAIEILVSGRNVGEFCNLHVGCGSLEKKLSKELLDATIEAKKTFILSYAEGDGHQYHHDDGKNRGKILIATASDSLASQVQVLALSAGIMCRIAKYERHNDKWSDTPIWHVIIPAWSVNDLINDSARWEQSDAITHNHCAFFINGYAALKIEKVAYCEKDDTVYNLELDATGDEKSFHCNGMVSHNCRTDAYIGRALELLSDLPMSKLTLNMPKAGGKLTKELSEEILAFCTYQLEVINAFEMCQSTLWELNMIGNVYWFMEWDDKKKMWSRAVMLPPEEVYIFQYPFSENKRVEYRPQRLISLIKSQGEGETASETPKGDYDRSAMNEKIVEGVPDEMKEMVLKEGCIVMDTDPMTGSFVHHIARRRSPYMDLGASVLERVLVPMLQKEHYRYTQLSLASRNMTPKNLITAPGLMPDELDDLRTQVDLSYMDPEYSVITNYEVTWQQIGVQERMLDFSREYEQIENQVFAGLGVTRELLTGEGAFSGTKITIEILNTMFLLTREVLRNFIEKQIFIPVCEAHGWFEEDKNGAKKYWYPSIGFNRLTIRDNAEVFDSLFQLYSKGSLPVEVIYELFNLNSEEMHAKLLAGMFTAKDSTFNRMVEEVNTEVGRALVQQTDVIERTSKYLGLEFRGPPEQEGGGEGGGDGFQQEDAPQTDGGVAPEGEGGGQEADQGQDQGAEAEGSQPDPEAIAKEVADSLPPDASPQDIDEALQAVADEAGG